MTHSPTEKSAGKVFSRPWDVWEFRSVDGRQVVTKALPSHVGSTKYQHEYQRLIGQVIALNATEALSLALSGRQTS